MISQQKGESGARNGTRAGYKNVTIESVGETREYDVEEVLSRAPLAHHCSP